MAPKSSVPPRESPHTDRPATSTCSASLQVRAGSSWFCGNSLTSAGLTRNSSAMSGELAQTGANLRFRRALRSRCLRSTLGHTKALRRHGRPATRFTCGWRSNSVRLKHPPRDAQPNRARLSHGRLLKWSPNTTISASDAVKGAFAINASPSLPAGGRPGSGCPEQLVLLIDVGLECLRGPVLVYGGSALQALPYPVSLFPHVVVGPC